MSDKLAINEQKGKNYKEQEFSGTETPRLPKDEQMELLRTRCPRSKYDEFSGARTSRPLETPDLPIPSRDEVGAVIINFGVKVISGIKEGIGFIPHIPESLIYMVVLNIPSVLRGTVSPLSIGGKYLFGKRNIGEILREEKEAILMTEAKSLWVNNVREFFNSWVPGGSLFGDDHKFITTTDDKLKEIVNPLHNLSKAFIEPLVTPLHEVAEGFTDRITYCGYNIYRHCSKEKVLSYREFLQAVEDENNWQLRLWKNALYGVESVILAYYCGSVGCSTRLEAMKRTANFLKMPFVMTTLQAIGSTLKQENYEQLSNKELIALTLNQIPQGVFSSAVFMLPISKLSQMRINQGISRLNKNLSSHIVEDSTGLKFPKQTLSQYQRDVNKLIARTTLYTELFDATEGGEEAYSKGITLEERIEALCYNPYSRDNWRLFFSGSLEFSSAALDLVDRKNNRGFNQAQRAVSEKAQGEIDSLLRTKTLELQDLSEVQNYFEQYLCRKLEVEGYDSILPYLSLPALYQTAKDNLRKEISLAAKSVYAFYDKSRDIIVVPSISPSATREEQLLHQSYVIHEEFHRRVAKHPGGILAILEESPEILDTIEEKILPPDITLEDILSQQNPLYTLEEYAAIAYQTRFLDSNGLEEISSDISSRLARQLLFSLSHDVFLGEDLSAAKAGAIRALRIRLKKLNDPSKNFEQIEIMRFYRINEDFIAENGINILKDYPLAYERIHEANEAVVKNLKLDMAIAKQLFGGRGKGNAVYYIEKLREKGVVIEKVESLFTQGNPAYFVSFEALFEYAKKDKNSPQYRLLLAGQFLKLEDFLNLLKQKPFLSLVECAQILNMGKGFVALQASKGKLKASGLSGSNEHVLIDDLIAYMKRSGLASEVKCLEQCREEYKEDPTKGLNKFRELNRQRLEDITLVRFDEMKFEVSAFYPLLGYQENPYGRVSLNKHLKKLFKTYKIRYQEADRIRPNKATIKEIYVSINEFMHFLECIGAKSRSDVLRAIRKNVAAEDSSNTRVLDVEMLKKRIRETCLLNPLLNSVEVGKILGNGRKRILGFKNLPRFTWLEGKRVTIKKYALLDVLQFLEERGNTKLARELLQRRKEYIDSDGRIIQDALFEIVGSHRRSIK